MIPKPGNLRTLWRVGYHADPLGFTSLDLYEFSHRFDDIHRRFRTIYCAELPETSLREVLADFRPSLGALRRHVERYGPEAACVGRFIFATGVTDHVRGWSRESKAPTTSTVAGAGVGELVGA